MAKYTRRPSDLCARYGGEEFALVFGNTTADKLRPIMDQLLQAIRQLAIPNQRAPTRPIVTLSVGLATVHPKRRLEPEALVKKADERLYFAKSSGRDRIAM